MFRARIIKSVAVAILALCWAALAAGCVSVGYDFLKQQATLTYTHPPKLDGLKK
jgi:hypothetical protein